VEGEWKVKRGLSGIPSAVPRIHLPRFAAGCFRGTLTFHLNALETRNLLQPAVRAPSRPLSALLGGTERPNAYLVVTPCPEGTS